jgi:hypothetical protein
MTLIGFHRFLIAAGVAFCLGFAAWQIRAFLLARAPGALLLAALFALLAVALAIYLARLDRFLGTSRSTGRRRD